MPTFNKVWEHVPNIIVTIGSDIDDRNQRAMLAMHQAMTDQLDTRNQADASIVMTSPVTVLASSDSVTADATDNWAAQSDIVFDDAGNAHSWMNGRFVDFFGSGDHLDYVIDLIPADATDDAMIYMAFSRDGWNSDGTTTNRPTPVTAGDLVVVRDGVTVSGDSLASDCWIGSDSVNNQAVLHYSVASDGSARRCVICQGGVVTAMWCVWHDVAGPTRAAASDPYTAFYLCHDTTAEIMTEANIDGLAFFYSHDTGGTSVGHYIVTYRFNSNGDAVVSNNNSAHDSTRVPLPVFVANSVPEGVLDFCPDMWWGDDADATGDLSPTTGTTNTAQIGHLIIPYPDNATMQVS